MAWKKISLNFSSLSNANRTTVNALTSPFFSPLYQEHGPSLPRLPVPTVVKRRVISSGGCGGGRGGGCQRVHWLRSDHLCTCPCLEKYSQKYNIALQWNNTHRPSRFSPDQNFCKVIRAFFLTSEYLTKSYIVRVSPRFPCYMQHTKIDARIGPCSVALRPRPLWNSLGRLRSRRKWYRRVGEENKIHLGFAKQLPCLLTISYPN